MRPGTTISLTMLLFPTTASRILPQPMRARKWAIRMAATPGSKSYGRLSIMLGCHMEVQPLFDVPPEAFSPPPKVNSSVVALRPLPDTAFRISDPDGFSRLVAKAFSQRRKTVRNALKGLADLEQLTEAGIDPTDRPERIPVENWVALANSLLPDA